MMPKTSAASDEEINQSKLDVKLLASFMLSIKKGGPYYYNVEVEDEKATKNEDRIKETENAVIRAWNLLPPNIKSNINRTMALIEEDQLTHECNPLHIAVSENNLAAVRALLKLEADPNYPDSKDRRGRYVPLRIALDNEYFKIASILIGAGVSPNSPSMYGSKQQLHSNLLQFYVERNKEKQAIFLIENNADLNPPINPAALRASSGIPSHQQIDETFLKDYANKHCPSLILEAYEKQMYEVVNAILKRDKNYINAKYPSQHQFAGDTMLHRAAKENNLEMVETLLNFGANPNEENKEHETPLTLLANRKNFDANTLQIARLLILQSALQNPDVNEKLDVIDSPNKTLISKIDVMLFATSCLQSVFRYAMKIDEKLSAYNIDKDNILQALINSKLTWLVGNVAATNNKQDSDEMKGARVACTDVFKEILTKLNNDIRNIFNGTQRDDSFLFIELVKDFLSKKRGNSIGYQSLAHKIQGWYPKDRYPNLYSELPHSQEANQQFKALEDTGSTSTHTDSQSLPPASGFTDLKTSNISVPPPPPLPPEPVPRTLPLQTKTQAKPPSQNTAPPTDLTAQAEKKPDIVTMLQNSTTFQKRRRSIEPEEKDTGSDNADDENSPSPGSSF